MLRMECTIDTSLGNLPVPLKKKTTFTLNCILLFTDPHN